MARFAVPVLLMMFCAALSAQEPTVQQKIDELQKELARLQDQVKKLESEKATADAENVRLKKEVEQLQRFSIDAAEKLSRLRVLAENPSRSTEPAVPPKNPDNGTGAKPEIPVGPVTPIKAKVLVVVPDYGFLIIDKGESDGIKAGWTFDILRKEADSKYALLGQAVFEKFVESSKNTQSKLKITKGIAEKMKYDDLAVAVRVIDPTEATKPPPDGTGAKTEDKKFKITGLNEGTFFLDYGGRDGARQTDRVFIYRDNRLIAQLRLDSVDKEWSAAKIIDNTKMAEPVVGDGVQLKEIRSQIIGKVKRNDDKTGIYLDNVGTMWGAKVGMVFEVRRQGRPVGKIVLKEVNKFWSKAEPQGETKREDIQEEDFVESVE